MLDGSSIARLGPMRSAGYLLGGALVDMRGETSDNLVGGFGHSFDREKGTKMRKKERRVCARISPELFEAFRLKLPWYRETQLFIKKCIEAVAEGDEKTIKELREETRKEVLEG